MIEPWLVGKQVKAVWKRNNGNEQVMVKYHSKYDNLL